MTEIPAEQIAQIRKRHEASEQQWQTRLVNGVTKHWCDHHGYGAHRDRGTLLTALEDGAGAGREKRLIEALALLRLNVIIMNYGPEDTNEAPIYSTVGDLRKILAAQDQDRREE